MNAITLQTAKFPGLMTWFCVVSLMLVSLPLSAQTSTDLYQQGRQFYEAGDYLRAAEYLFSCWMMASSNLPPDFKRQLQDALAYAEEHIRVAIETKKQLDIHGKVTKITVQASGKTDDPSGRLFEKSIPFQAPIDPAGQRPVLPTNLPQISFTVLPLNLAHCARPSTPVLVYPGHNTVQPNHYYGQGQPWRFDWLDSSCEGGRIRGYRIIVKAVGYPTPNIDTFVEQSQYIGDLSGTYSAQNWTWKVQAVDDRNQLSDWSEERSFYVPPWRQ